MNRLLAQALTLAVLLPCAAAPVAAQQSAPVRLNNFVVQLADVDLRGATAPHSVTVSVDRPEWLFIELRGQGQATVSLAAGESNTELPILQGPGETMRRVPAGQITLRLQAGAGAALQRLIVRRVPEIMVYMFEGESAADPHACLAHSWDDLQRAVLHSANLLVSPNLEAYAPYAQRWHDRGGRWLINQGMSALRDETVDLAQHWANLLGGKVWDGSIHDEVVTEDLPRLARYADGLARFRALPESAGKTVYLYCGGPAAIGDPTLLDFFQSSDQTAAHGERSLLCRAQAEETITARQLQVRLEPGVQYTISAYLRGAAVVPARYTGLFVIDEGWYSLYGRLRPPAGDSDWTRYQASFTPGPSRNGLYQVVICGPASGDLWIDAVQIEPGADATDFTPAAPNLLANPSFEDGLDRWLQGTQGDNPLRDAVIQYDHAFAPEIYLSEQQTEERARSLIQQRLVRMPAAWSRHYPGVNPHALIVLSVGDCALRYSDDRSPQANYKVLLDLQFHALATAADGATDLRGIGFWSAHYGSPEALRWYGALFRHYCIEGSTERLTHDPYLLDHLVNPGFEDGLSGWECAGAVEAVKVADMPGGGARGKYAPVPEGQGAVRTLRAEGGAANSFGQMLRNLQPGRLYSLKFYCTDPQYSARLIPAEVTISAGEVLPEYTWDNYWSTRSGGGVWTMHWRVFRATASQGRLTISDAAPGELYWDFIQVEPFFAG